MAGIVIGPHAAGLVHDPEGTELLASSVDLPAVHHRPRPAAAPLGEMRTRSSAGLAQVALTSVAIAVVAYAARCRRRRR
ncbi:MAG: hypothetical protein U5L08_06530 [Xanthomonadales bacterium]|nr:hypothetical protein [Xanthomonadales bacterium]